MPFHLFPSPAQPPRRPLLFHALALAPLSLALVSALAFIGCKTAKPPEPAPIDSASVQFSNADQIRPLQPSQNEVLQLVAVRQAGLTDSNCLELLQLARKTNQPFSDGDAIAQLLGVGESPDTIMTLARMGELGPFSGEVLAMHLANIPDSIILDVARRRAAGQPSLSGDMIAELIEAGYTRAQVTMLLDKGTTDAEAQTILDYHSRASAHGFIRNGGRRRH
jgi:hypothetical protein